MITATSQFEQTFWSQGKNLVCGVDEVGRGCFAGPVVAGAVVFSPDSRIPEGLADSKLLSQKAREELIQPIMDNAICWAVVPVDVDIINAIGVGKATQVAFVKAIQSLTVIPDQILVDAFFITDLDHTNQQPIPHGDRLSVSIAAASIMAKVFRDNLMQEFDLHFPNYGFATHKGYGTKAHQSAIKQKGLCPLHRTSFNLQKFL